MRPRFLTITILILAVAAPVLGVGGTVVSQSPVHTGIGNVKCADFLQYRVKDKEKIDDRFDLWVAGYLSGRNYASSTNRREIRALFGTDPLLTGGVGNFLSSFCVIRPKAYIHEAADALFQRFPKLK